MPFTPLRVFELLSQIFLSAHHRNKYFCDWGLSKDIFKAKRIWAQLSRLKKERIVELLVDLQRIASWNMWRDQSELRNAPVERDLSYSLSPSYRPSCTSSSDGNYLVAIHFNYYLNLSPIVTRDRARSRRGTRKLGCDVTSSFRGSDLSLDLNVKWAMPENCSSSYTILNLNEDQLA